jgi:stage II sporulation protein D
MKAQAVAARTFAMYKKNHPQSEDFDVYDDERDQVYNPSVTVTNQHRQSVTDTNRVVLKYTGDYHTIICAFYVSGTGSTAQYVTYNEGKSGNDISQTSLGYTTNPPSKFPDNRGCMGQVQANRPIHPRNFRIIGVAWGKFKQIIWRHLMVTITLRY